MNNDKTPLKQINDLCGRKDLNEVIKLCSEHNVLYFGNLLTTAMIRKRANQPEIKDDMVKYHKFFIHKILNKVVKIKLLCSWTSSEELTRLWSKMRKSDSRIELTLENPDYYVVINSTTENVPLEKCIYFQMEPLMTVDKWGFWADKSLSDKFLFYGNHEDNYNNIEWHLNKTYDELLNSSPIKEYDLELSCIVSSKYQDEGQIKRIDFIKYIEDKIPVNVYGDNNNYRNYICRLNYHCKDDGLFPYKYHFNAENHCLDNYYITEKLIDGILAECLVFYYGSPLADKLFNPDCFVRLELVDFDNDLKIIKDAIENDLWSQRIDIIRNEKKRILTELSMFPRIENILKSKLLIR